MWCWRRLLRVLWTARRSNQSILKEINPEYSLEGLMLKFQYFGHLMWRTDSLEKTLMLGKIEGKRRKRWQRMRWLDANADSMKTNVSTLREDSEGQGSLGAAVHGVTENQTRLSDRKITNDVILIERGTDFGPLLSLNIEIRHTVFSLLKFTRKRYEQRYQIHGKSHRLGTLSPSVWTITPPPFLPFPYVNFCPELVQWPVCSKGNCLIRWHSLVCGLQRMIYSLWRWSSLLGAHPTPTH